jgi:hypothetical protein
VKRNETLCHPTRRQGCWRRGTVGRRLRHLRHPRRHPGPHRQLATGQAPRRYAQGSNPQRELSYGQEDVQAKGHRRRSSRFAPCTAVRWWFARLWSDRSRSRLLAAKKIRALALRHALSSKVKSGDLIIVDTVSVKEAKTASLRETLGKLGWTKALIIAGPEVDTNFGLAARNIPHIDVLPNAGLNVYDILRADKLVLTKAAIEAIEARFSDKEAA